MQGFRIPLTMRITYLFATPLLMASLSFAQSASGGGSSSLESEMMAYQAIDRITQQIAKTINSGAGQGTPVLMNNQVNMSQIAAFLTFKATAETLESAYAQKKPIVLSQEGEFHTNALLGGALGGADLGGTLSGVAALLAAIKASTATSNSTFTAVDQAFISGIEKNASSTRIVSVPFPADVQTGGDAISDILSDVYSARTDAAQALIKAHPSDAGKPPYDPSPDLKDLDAQLTTLQGSLAASTSSSGSVLLGAGLLAALGAITPTTDDAAAAYSPTAVYRILSFTNDVAGGGTRTNQIFAVSFFFPWPHPSFNGGAIVSYSLRGSDGKLISAGTLNHIYGYTKWNAPKADKKGFSNLDR